MKRLSDVPAGRDLMSSLYDAARDLSLAYAGTPDDRAETSLQLYVSRILPGLQEALGPSMAALIVREFTVAVMAQKRRLEGAGASRA